MLKRIHLQTEIKLDINLSESAMPSEAQRLMTETIKKVWPETYLADFDYEDYIDIAVDLWLRYYIISDNMKESINKIHEAKPPYELKIYLVFNLFDNEDNLKIDVSEIEKTPLFRAYLPTKDLWDTYLYRCADKGIKCKFESLEIIEPAYISEIKLSMTDKQKEEFDNIILQAYGFHQRLLGVKTKKIRVYTSQPEKVIKEWNSQGYIPKGTYLTDKLQRAEYYFETGDIIVDYTIPEDKIVQTSEFGGAKEFVSIENIPIK